MTDEDAKVGLQATDYPDRAPLYGDNRDGVLHNNPGFAAVQGGIAKKEGIPMKNAGAILANASRNASPAAKKANPSLKKLQGWIERGRAIHEIEDSMGFQLITNLTEIEIRWAHEQLEVGKLDVTELR